MKLAIRCHQLLPADGALSIVIQPRHHSTGMDATNSAVLLLSLLLLLPLSALPSLLLVTNSSGEIPFEQSTDEISDRQFGPTSLVGV